MVKVAKYQINPCSAMLPKNLPTNKNANILAGKLERGEESAFSASAPVPQKAGLCADHISSVRVVLANLSGCTAGAFRLSRSKRPLRSAGKMTGALD